MAYFKFKANTAFSVSNIGQDVGKALKVVENCLNGTHTSSSTWGNYSGEDSNIWDKDNSLVINDAAHRQTKHAGALWGNGTNPTASTVNQVYHLKAGAYGYSYSSTQYAYFDFYKRHYMSNLINGASTTTSFSPYVHFRLSWRSGYGWSIRSADRNGANSRPRSENITSVSNYPTENTSNFQIMTSAWNQLDEIHIWLSETFFAIAIYQNAGVVSYNNRNSGKNLFYYWGDFPYIDSIDGYHYGRNTIYYPGCWLQSGMSAHDVRLKNLSPDTSDYQSFGVGRYGGVTGLNEYFNHPTVNASGYLNMVNAHPNYAQYASMWPHPLSPRTPIPTANGTGPFLIPCQYNGNPMLGRDERVNVPTNAGTQAASAQNLGDSRAGQMLGLYQVPDEFGTAPGDRFKVGDEFYRTVWTHKKGGSYGSFLDGDNSETNVYALPEKSQIGPDPI